MYAGIMFLSSLIIGGCEKEQSTPDVEPQKKEYIAFCDLVHDTDADNYLRIGWFTIDGTVIDADNIEADAEKYSIILDDDVTYSYQVSEKISGSGGVLSSTKKDYEGTLKESAFFENQLNKIEVVRDGADWKILVNEIGRAHV